MFAYCGNNPINYSDSAGYFRNDISALAFQGGSDSYIYNQNHQPNGDVSLGWSTVADTGCGPIATYNAMHLLGEYDITLNEVVDYFKDNGHLFLGGFLGTSYVGCMSYLEEHGYTVYATTDVQKYAELAGTADVCILLFGYAYPSFSVGAHYVAFTQDGNLGTYYNPFTDSRGPYTFSGDCYDFLTYVDGVFPLLILIYE